MKSVLNVRTGKLCSKVVSLQRSEIPVWQLSSDFVNYLPFRFYRHLITEKQLCRPRSLPGIAYPFELERGHIPLRTRRKMKSSFEALLREFVEKKHNSQTIKQIRRYFCAWCVVKSSLFNKRFHSNVIEELQNFCELQ